MQRELPQSEEEMARWKEDEELEAEYVMVTEMTFAEELRTDAKLMKVLEDKESLEKEVEALKKVNAENELKMRDLERIIGDMERKEIEEKKERISVEEEMMMRDKIDSQNKKINVWRLGIEELEKLEKVVAQKKSELEEWAGKNLNLKGLKYLELQGPVISLWPPGPGAVAALAAAIVYASYRKHCMIRSVGKDDDMNE